MEINWKVVRTFRFAHEAELARSILEQEGVTAIVADANTIEMDWMLSNAIGFTKLQVPAAQLVYARQILSSHDELIRQEELAADNTCLACQSPMAESDDHCESCGWSYEDLAIPMQKYGNSEFPLDEYDTNRGIFNFFQRNRRLIMATYFVPIIGPVLVTLIIWWLFGILI